MWRWMWPQRIHLVVSAGGSQSSASAQHHHSVSWHTGKLEGKGPVKQHDDDAEHPLKDGRRMLQDEALLDEKNTTEHQGYEGQQGHE